LLREAHKKNQGGNNKYASADAEQAAKYSRNKAEQ
jgi:hypothetical protein